MAKAEVTGPSAAVAGFGLVCPLGGSAEAARAALAAGDSAIEPLSRFRGPAEGEWLSAEAPPVDTAALLAKPKDAKLVGRSTSLALAAVRELLDRLPAGSLPSAGRVGVFVASGQTGLESAEFFRAIDASRQPPPDDLHTLGGRPARAIDPFFSLRTLANAAAYYIGEMAPASGPSQTFVQGPAASIHAVEAAIAALHTGECSAAIVAAHDCLILPSIYEILAADGTLATETSTSGIVPGEAGAAVLLSSDATGLASLEVVGSTGEHPPHHADGCGYLGAAHVLVDLLLWLALGHETSGAFGVPPPWRHDAWVRATRA